MTDIRHREGAGAVGNCSRKRVLNSANRSIGLQEALSRMILKSLPRPHVLTQNVERLVSGLIGHFEDAGAIAGRAGQKSASQAVPGVAAWLELDFRSEFLNDECNALR